MKDWVRSVHRAREVLHDAPSHMPVAVDPIRPVVYESWLRCRRQGLHPDRVVPIFQPDVTTENELTRVAAAVVDLHADALTQSMSALSLTDAQGRIVRRWDTDHAMARRLDTLDVAAGFSVDEATLGTSSMVTLLTGKPILVRGPEHFNDRFHLLSCAGAPIINPVSRRVIGSLHLTCRLADTNPLVLAWVQDRVVEIENALRASSSRGERLLLDAYLSHNRDSRHPLVVLNQNTVITNAAAARLLAAVDQTMLWEHAARSLREGTQNPRTLKLTDGTLVACECRPVYDGGESVGAVIVIKPLSTGGSHRAIGKSKRTLPGLVGAGERWDALCQQAMSTSAGLVLVVGEPGSGRLAVAQSIASPAPVSVLDAADAAKDEEQWIRDVDFSVQVRDHVLILRHIDQLPRLTAVSVQNILRRHASARVFATSAAGPSSAPTHNPIISEARSVLDVPPLRERMEDLPDLLSKFTAVDADGHAVQWLPDAVQALSRLEWPGNLNELSAVVSRVTTQGHTGYVGVRDLPADILALSTGRRLARLERAEAQTIMLALQDARGNKLQAAESLGIARSTLYRKMRALGLNLATAAY